jgi:hypothetical protein
MGLHAGAQVLRVFAAQDQARMQADDQSLLAMTPRFLDDHRLDQTLRYHNGAYLVEDVRLHVNDGVGMSCTVDPQALLALLTIDGKQTLGQLLDEAGDELTTEDAASMAGLTLSTVRRLVALGMMVLDPPM